MSEISIQLRVVPVKADAITDRGRWKAVALKLIRDFEQSDADIVKVEKVDGDAELTENQRSRLYNSLKIVIDQEEKRMKAFTRKGIVYIQKISQ